MSLAAAGRTRSGYPALTCGLRELHGDDAGRYRDYCVTGNHERRSHELAENRLRAGCCPKSKSSVKLGHYIGAARRSTECSPAQRCRKPYPQEYHSQRRCRGDEAASGGSPFFAPALKLIVSLLPEQDERSPSPAIAILSGSPERCSRIILPAQSLPITALRTNCSVHF
jgi:hypothetical protein